MVAASWRVRNPDMDAFVADQEGVLGELAGLLVDLVRKTVPSAEERIHHGAPWFRVDGTWLGYVAVHARHVNLGFRYGALLDDPDGLLEGTGKQMRHVKVSDPDDVPVDALAGLIERAAKLEAPD